MANAWRGGDAVMPHAGQRHLAPFMEAQQRDLMPLRRQSFGRHAHGNGRAAFLVKGLGRQHQYLHEAILRRSWLPRKCRSEKHTSELQSLMRISYAVFCLKKKNN